VRLGTGRPLRYLAAERHTVALRFELLHHMIAVADALAYAYSRNIIDAISSRPTSSSATSGTIVILATDLKAFERIVVLLT